MTRAEYEDVEDYLYYEDVIPANIELPSREDLERGGIVGVATIVDCIPSDRRASIWHMEGQFGFKIADARTLPFVECKGALGFFNVPAHVADHLRAAHAPA